MNSPFKFLDAYQKSDIDRFFGREKETAQLYNAVFAANLTLLYGASGTGKTSLINCGLGNKFYETDWLPLFIRREDNINSSLDKVILQAIGDNSPNNFGHLPIRQKIKQLYLEFYKPVYLIFDQFEELFILGSKQEQQQFYRNIALLLQSGLQAKIIISTREEWIAYLNDFEKIVPSLFDNRLRIERMNDKNIYRVLAGTVRHHGIKVNTPSQTLLKIIEHLKEKRERVDLTNLQVYLDRLFREAVETKGNYQNGQVIFDLPLVQQIGSIQNVLSVFLDEQLEALEAKLAQRGVKNPKGLPLEILFTLVTEDGTKQALEIHAILDNLPKNRQIGKEQLEFCLKEFQNIKLLKQFE